MKSLIRERVQHNLQRLAYSGLFQIDLRNSEIDLQRVDFLEIDDILPVLDVIANAHHAQTNNSGKGCLDFKFGQARLREIKGCLRKFEAAFSFIARLRGNEAFGEQVARAFDATFAETKISFSLLQFSALNRGVKANQHRTFCDTLAFAKADFADAPGYLGSDGHGFIRAQGSDCREALCHAHGFHYGGLYGNTGRRGSGVPRCFGGCTRLCDCGVFRWVGTGLRFADPITADCEQ